MHSIRRLAVAASFALLALDGSATLATTDNPADQADPTQMTIPPKPFPDAPYWNPKLPVKERVDDLLSRMTLEEKVAQMISVWTGKTRIQHADYTFDPAKATKLYPNGLGFFTRPSDKKGPVSPRVLPPRTIRQSVAYVNAVQAWSREHTRLGIPVLFHEEALHGLAALNATSFPVPMGLASTWDPGLVREANTLIASQVRARGVYQVLSPVVDVARDPRWGRIEETFGEDPYLVGEMGVAAVEGLEGPGKDPRLAPDHVLATLKHMTGHGEPQSGTNVGPALIGERDLRSVFFPPFQQVVKRTAIASVMASYNEIDGIPSHSNRWLLHDVLRGEWGFPGAVVSDYDGIEQLDDLHHITPDYAGAARLALKAGVDVDFPDGEAYKTLVRQVKDGKVPIAEINQAVRLILTMKFNAGLFEHPFVTDIKPALASDGPSAVALARKAAAESLILLKNDGTLPLALPASETGHKPTIAVIGPDADKAHLGGYYGIPRHTVSPLAGIEALVGNRANIVYSKGVVITKSDDWWADKVQLGDPAKNRERIKRAVATARKADVILLVIGDTEQTSREAWAPNHLGDRDSLDLVGQQNALFNALKALGKPVVAVLVNGRPPSYPNVAAHANAILETWYAGEQQGNAIADALFGRINPGGKLPVTVARTVGQVPIYYDYKPSARRGYLFSKVSPLYPFGWGLSYTTFRFGKPVLSSSTIHPGDGVKVTVPVTNTGKRTGDEVVQVYLRDEVSSVTRPVKELCGFQRVTLKPGETRQVRIAIRPGAFGLWNRQMKFVTEPGAFKIMVGPNSQDLQDVDLMVAS